MKLTNLFGFFKKDTSAHIETSKGGSIPSIHAPIGDAQLFIASGTAKVKAKDYLGALHDFDRAISITPNCTQGYIDKVTAYNHRSKVNSILKDSKGAARDHSEAGVILKQLDAGMSAHDSGRAKYNSGDYVGAITQFDKAVECGFFMGQTYLLRGLAKKYSDDFNGAVDDLTKAIELKPSDAEPAEAFCERGLIKAQKLDDAEGALQDYDMAIRLNPSYADAYYSRALLKDGLDAISDLDKAISLAPTVARLYLCRSLKRFALKDTEGAIRDVSTCIDFTAADDSASMVQAYSLRKSIRFIAGNLHGAIEDASKVIALDSSSAEAFFTRGLSKELLKDYQGAVGDYSKVIELEPSNAVAYHNRGLLRLELGMADDGRNDLIDAIIRGYEEDDEEEEEE
jgi:tetratricopeptide (TPR) repeat protein